MPTAIYDSSLLTQRKRAKALYAYNAALQAARASGANVTVRTEQPTLQSGEIITARKQGGCFCVNDAAGLSITNQGPGACGCGR